MLKSLSIRNYVLIDQLDIQFDKGLSVVTGETGAGKSIMLGALSLVLGQRADAKSIQSGADKCVIEAVLDISAYGLESFFKEEEIEYDPTTCILRRELYASGKSRAFVNDSPVFLITLKDLGNRLIDIHSQHQNLLLGDNRFQLKVVDAMARNEDLLTAYSAVYSSYQTLQKTREEWLKKALLSKQEEDYVRFQYQQLADAQLEAGEQTRWEEEQEMLSHAEEIKNNLFRITNLLQSEEQGCLTVLKDALSTSGHLERYYAKAKEMTERIRTAYIDLNDLSSEAEGLQEDIEFNPQRLVWIEERLNIIYSLQQKHRLTTVDELLALQEKYEIQLREIESFDEHIAAVTKEMEAAYLEVQQLAARLSEQRQSVSASIADQLVTMIVPLGMPHARFQIAFSARHEPGVDGMDDISFLFSANKSAELQPVAQTASGGEISRLMLCVKALIAGFTALPTIIFDEIDSGVSGDIASRMGDIMQELGKKMQVVTITHLPQVAAKGNMHYYVYKEDMLERTFTRIRQLSPDERIHEIARMLSGATLTEAAVANAKELLRTSKRHV